MKCKVVLLTKKLIQYTLDVKLGFFLKNVHSSRLEGEELTRSWRAPKIQKNQSPELTRRKASRLEQSANFEIDHPS